MKKLALAALLMTSCASQIPECWEVSNDTAMGSSVPIRKVGKKLWLLTARHNYGMKTAGDLKIIDQIPHPTADVALISVEGDARLTPIATRPPKLGDLLFAAGYQAGALLITQGYQGSKPDRMSCPIFYGASGGPVWNAQRELVGINSKIARSRDSRGDLYAIPHLSMYAPVIDLLAWINENTKL